MPTTTSTSTTTTTTTPTKTTTTTTTPTTSTQDTETTTTTSKIDTTENFIKWPLKTLILLKPRQRQQQRPHRSLFQDNGSITECSKNPLKLTNDLLKLSYYQRCSMTKCRCRNHNLSIVSVCRSDDPRNFQVFDIWGIRWRVPFFHLNVRVLLKLAESTVLEKYFGSKSVNHFIWANDVRCIICCHCMYYTTRKNYVNLLKL